jgi:hypothetical protein
MRRPASARPRRALRGLRITLATVVAFVFAVGGIVPAAAAVALPAQANESSMASSVDSLIRPMTLEGFNPENLIDDALFFDGAAMTAAEIQRFLDEKDRCTNSRCINTGMASISSRAAVISHRTGNVVCNAIEGGTMRISELIYRVQVACGISAKVIIVTLEKEQSLVTGRLPTERNLNFAMGANCPDTAPCDPAYSGIGPQILAGTTSLKNYSAGRFARQPGVHFIGYDPDPSCGGTNLTIRNYATAALYNYTPYQPNANALRAGYGDSGDPCSSYGNRNFVNFFTDWFGASSDRSPFGGFNLVAERGKVTVLGWTLDPDSPLSPVEVSVAIDGQQNFSVFRANDARPDVAAAHPGYGPNHGIRRTIEVVGGDHRVCVTARNIGEGADTDFGCVTIWVETASPYGGVSAEAIPGGVRLAGWTLDRDTAAPLEVHVYIDGNGSIHRADGSRPDVGAAFPGMGDNHGLDVSLPLAVGNHEVCAYGINVGLGFNKLLGCSSVEVTTSANPVGALESVRAVPGGISMRGWAVDPNTSDPLSVHVYRGAVGSSLVTSVARDDVQSKYPSAPLTSGFDVRFEAPAGNTRVCAYGINRGWGENVTLGCETVTVMRGNPIGGISAEVTGQSVRVRGWTIDPDTADPIDLHLYVDGVGRALRASAERSDVGRVYPGYGSPHGIDTTLDLQPGRHEICAYGINVGPGGNALLNCVTVSVVNKSPFGGTNIASVDGEIRLQGWVIDPDTAEPVQVHVYVDGVGAAVGTADVRRPDVEAAYPGYGARHGIDLALPLTSGERRVCAYGINVGAGANTLLGCHAVTVR